MPAVSPLQSRHAMFKRIRRLHISLAAKCQLLFGAAVVLIIGAALFVPWQRMEQLTNQLNSRSARTLAIHAVEDHIAHGGLTRPFPDRDVAALSTGTPDTPPATSPSTIPTSSAPEPRFMPRLILAGPGYDDSALNPFEKRARSPSASCSV